MELVVGLRQVILGLVIETNKMTVYINNKYIAQVKDWLKEKWDSKIFKVSEMQKLVDKTTFGRGCTMDL